MRKTKLKDEKLERYNFRISTIMLNQLKLIADREGRTVSEIIREQVEIYIDKNLDKNKPTFGKEEGWKEIDFKEIKL